MKKTKQLKLEGRHEVFCRIRQRKAQLGKKHTEATKQKISKSLLGKLKLEEHKQHLRDSSPHLSGENNPMYGKGYLFAGENNPMYGKGYLLKGEENPMYGKGYLLEGEKNGRWKDGISFLPYCEKFDDDLKERVRNFFGRICFICGKTEQENGRKLSVHHVNYNKMVCCNDVKPLFVPLCISCHAKTNDERESWEEFLTASLQYLTNGECFLPKKEE